MLQPKMFQSVYWTCLVSNIASLKAPPCIMDCRLYDFYDVIYRFVLTIRKEHRMILSTTRLQVYRVNDKESIIEMLASPVYSSVDLRDL